MNPSSLFGARLLRFAPCLLLPLFGRAEVLFQFGPTDAYVAETQPLVAETRKPLDWGAKRLFSDFVPLTPPNLKPAIYGGYELMVYSKTGSGIFVDYRGNPTTAVNNNSFAGKTLDSIGVKAGFSPSEVERDISFGLAFLALGRLERPVASPAALAISTRLSYRMIGPVPGSLRAVIRSGGEFYASDSYIELTQTKDRRVAFADGFLARTAWRRYDPLTSVAADSEATKAPPTGAIDLAGVLVTRVVNAPARKTGDFETTEIAELVVETLK